MLEKNNKLLILLVIIIILITSIIIFGNNKENKIIQEKKEPIINNIVEKKDNSIQKEIKIDPNVEESGFSKLVRSQIENGRNYIYEIECNNLETKEEEDYCNSEKKELDKFKNQIIWKDILLKGEEYIKTYDCNKIDLEEGRNHCENYKNHLLETK